MNFTPMRLIGVGLLATVGLFVSAHPCRASGRDDITAVSSQASADYIRAKQPDGKYAPEAYAFADGGRWQGSMTDASIDKLTFLDVAHMIAYPLADQNYMPSKDPRTAKLMIMVYWGTTQAPEHANETGSYERVMQNQGAKTFLAREDLAFRMESVELEDIERDKTDLKNAQMLGYDSWWAQTDQFRGTFLEIRRQDMVDELELNRYFVVLMAYDFQLLRMGKRHKLLWVTRFSIRQMHHEFDKDLPAMAQYASQYFGQNTHGLVRTMVPYGRVDIGAMESLGPVPGK